MGCDLPSFHDATLAMQANFSREIAFANTCIIYVIRKRIHGLAARIILSKSWEFQATVTAHTVERGRRQPRGNALPPPSKMEQRWIGGGWLGDVPRWFSGLLAEYRIQSNQL
ncbi:hypothetical protein CYMTET_27119 [Cymbomonas tetramitiformis]|uniref:Uncharacterized protein n=1 Tax=Cymbomonas tetramitiformis TaxID=36881 RepID=A0AAE0FR10_9CHLO|nr:hypothetical protein CYMTET_27119 [Cymbomonas tetramitiformis]